MKALITCAEAYGLLAAAVVVVAVAAWVIGFCGARSLSRRRPR